MNRHRSRAVETHHYGLFRFTDSDSDPITITRQLAWESESDSVQWEKNIVNCDHMVNLHELNGKKWHGHRRNCWGLGFGVQLQKLNHIVGNAISVTNRKHSSRMHSSIQHRMRTARLQILHASVTTRCQYQWGDTVKILPSRNFVARDASLLGVQILSFSCSFRQNNRLSSPLQENPGSATVQDKSTSCVHRLLIIEFLMLVGLY